MTLAKFDAEVWVERIAQLLPPLALVQEPYLRESQEWHERMIGLRNSKLAH